MVVKYEGEYFITKYTDKLDDLEYLIVRDLGLNSSSGFIGNIIHKVVDVEFSYKLKEIYYGKGYYQLI